MENRFLFDPRYISSARRLDPREQQNMWRALEGLSRYPPPPGLKVERIKDTRRLASARISRKYRIVFWRPRKQATLVLLMVGHHDDVYRFAIRWRPRQLPGYVMMALEGLCDEVGLRRSKLLSAGVDRAVRIGHAARRLLTRPDESTCFAPMTLQEIRQLIEVGE